MELSSSSSTQSGHHLRTVQTTAEGTPFSGSMNTMALCDFDMRRLRRTLAYLLTYKIATAFLCIESRPGADQDLGSVCQLNITVGGFIQ